MPRTCIISNQSLNEYFREGLDHHSSKLSPPPQEDTLWYIGEMLVRLSRSSQLYTTEQNEITLRPLAMYYQDAIASNTNHERCLILRQLGDIALFMGALFPETFYRKGIRKDYLIGMGGSAYDYLSDNSSSHRHVFKELAETFTSILQLIAKVCAKKSHFDASDIFAIYQRWLESKDPILKRQLESIGITPVVTDQIQ